jgi:hypothetical protein
VPEVPDVPPEPEVPPSPVLEKFTTNCALFEGSVPLI